MWNRVTHEDDAAGRLTEAASQLLIRLAEAGEDLEVTIKIRGVLATLRVGPAAGGKSKSRTLNEMEQCILEALGSETLTGEALAEKAGYPFNSSFRQHLAGLVRRGILRNPGVGYSVASTIE